MKIKQLFICLILCLACVTLGLAQQKKIKALIIDGQNNHAVWPKSTIMMQQYLEETGLFAVDIARTKYINNSKRFHNWLDYAQQPFKSIEGKPKTDPDFSPNFSDYDVVISNFGFKAAPWSSATQKKFEKYMKKGGGFVSVHAADNCFPNWEAYNQMIGIGGWGGRTEKHGPYLYVDKNNKVVTDHSPGHGGTHGKREEFVVTTFNDKHPITKGFPHQWMHTSDECYAKLRGPAKKVKILATAVSTKKDPALGQKEPVVMTIKYKKGRIFHTTLGHDETAFSSVGLITLIQRGTEWAATGKVTQKLPSDFPNAEKSVARKFYYRE
ncbi:ThuA domain-containing protein [Ochrovirga pacifica]|uniref:ThuA domain-containing protein n=1 Tax=Ochrovirga pacifica TaxID=1042376 RepID=UPI0002557BCC|nr:ThuA domain-containing protein [Ochrovirga pacifica]